MRDPNEERTLTMTIREWRLVDSAMDRIMETGPDSDFVRVFNKVFDTAYPSD